MNTRNLVIAGVIVAVISLAATQVFAMPSYFYGWGSVNRGPMAMMGGANGHMNGNACNMMNGQEMTGMMNGESMNHQQCQEYMGPNHDMTAEECQAMYEDHHA